MALGRHCATLPWTRHISRWPLFCQTVIKHGHIFYVVLAFLPATIAGPNLVNCVLVDGCNNQVSSFDNYALSSQVPNLSHPKQEWHSFQRGFVPLHSSTQTAIRTRLSYLYYVGCTLGACNLSSCSSQIGCNTSAYLLTNP